MGARDNKEDEEGEQQWGQQRSEHGAAAADCPRWLLGVRLRRLLLLLLLLL
jgi:hypothetical protein